MAYQYIPCIVVDIIELTELIRIYKVEFPKEFPLSYKAGQFVMFDLPIESKITNRSYSIASAPDGSQTLEFLIVLNPQGLGTNHLFFNISIGDVLHCSKPIGKFYLPEIIDFDLCFVCTGTGVAPFRAMIADIFNKNTAHRKIKLIYGVRNIRELAFYDEFMKLQQNHPEFTFYPVLSRETPVNWHGQTGYVHAVYKQLYKEVDNTHFFLCGFGNMLKEARENLNLIGFDKSQVKFESYD